MRKGEFVRSALLLSHKSAKIDLIKMDTGDVPSVLEAANEIRKKYSRIDYLFLNAGILPVKRLNFWGLFNSKIMERLRTGEEVMVLDNPVNNCGIPTIFSTNVLGHFILVQDLMPLLTSDNNSQSKIIWTTSNNATKTSFSMDDFMCERGPSAYGSSKYIMNGISIALNEQYNRDNVYSCLAEPGLVVSNMAGQLLPGWLWTIVALIFKMLRLFLSHFTLSAHNGAEALLWLFKQDAKFLEKDSQYTSCVNIYDNPYVKNIKINVSRRESKEIYDKMMKIAEDVKEQINRNKNVFDYRV